MNTPNLSFPIAENATYWFLWLITAVVCIGAAVRALSRQEQILGFVPVFCLAFGYFYVFQSAVVAVTLSHRLQPWMLATAQGLALACLLATLAGNYLGSSRSRLPRAAHAYSYQPSYVWYIGVLLMVIGILAQYTFFNALYVGTIEYKNTSYWYLLYNVFYPGMAMCVCIYAGRREYHTPAVLLLLIILGTIFLYHWVATVRRSPMFPFFIAAVYTYYLTTRRVNRAILVSGLISVGLMMLFFVVIRDYGHIDGSWRAERLERVTLDDVVWKKAQTEDDNEFLYHSGYCASLVELERFQYGTGYLNLSIHWIPRLWWPDKPTLLDQGWYARLTGFEMHGILGWTMTPGATAGGIAESFQQFAWFMPVFWFALGRVIGRAYGFAYHRPTVPRQSIYVGMICVTHLLIAQGFIAAFVPACFYTIIPWLTFTTFRARADQRPKRAGALRPSEPARTSYAQTTLAR